MVKKIFGIEPLINRKKLDKDFEDHQLMIDNISKIKRRLLPSIKLPIISKTGRHKLKKTKNDKNLIINFGEIILPDISNV